MAYYAELDPNGIVTKVILGIDESEGNGEQIYEFQTGRPWRRTSYNTVGGVHKLGGTPFRKNFAGIGFKYDAERDAFIPPKPFESWVLNEDTCQWESPIPLPKIADTQLPYWDEENQEWIITERQTD